MELCTDDDDTDIMKNWQTVEQPIITSKRLDRGTDSIVNVELDRSYVTCGK